MKILFNISIVFIAFIFSCEQKQIKEMTVDKRLDTLKNEIKEKEDRALKNRKEMEEQYRIDSMRLSSTLNAAQVVAQQMLSTGKIFRAFDQTIDSVFNVKTTIERGTFFSSDFEHVIIKREAPNNILIDIYVVKNKELTNVLQHDEWTMTYISDTLKDINGDGYKDFLLNGYGSSGCCLKAFSNVYLYQPKTGSFTEQFDFINPTFSPKEKIIRGICYGHPGETEMYKYKWKEESIDTIEYISFEKNGKGEKTGKFISCKNEGGGERLKDKKRLNAVPKEYISIEGYDWFTGRGLE